MGGGYFCDGVGFMLKVASFGLLVTGSLFLVSGCLLQVAFVGCLVLVPGCEWPVARYGFGGWVRGVQGLLLLYAVFR